MFYLEMPSKDNEIKVPAQRARTVHFGAGRDAAGHLGRCFVLADAQIAKYECAGDERESDFRFIIMG